MLIIWHVGGAYPIAPRTAPRIMPKKTTLDCSTAWSSVSLSGWCLQHDFHAVLIILCMWPVAANVTARSRLPSEVGLHR